MNKQRKYKQRTLEVHAGEEVDPVTGARATPIYHTSSYAFESAEKAKKLYALEEEGYLYTRISNPTLDVLEKRVAAIEGGVGALSQSTGMSAILLAILNIANSGDEIVASNNLYGGTFTLFKNTMPNWGIKVNFVPTHDLEAYENAINENTKAIYCESIGNPKLDIPDFEEIAKIAHKHDLPLIVDNTSAITMIRPLEHGADIVVHSATKYLEGHNDTMAGIVVVKDEKLGLAMRNFLKYQGACLAPLNAWLTLRGIKTLEVRMQRHNENTMKVANYLRNHPKVKKVYYVGFEDHPNYEVTKKQTTGFGGMLSFEVDSKETALKVIDKVDMILFAGSLGGVESLITYPMIVTHHEVPEEVREKLGINDRFLRLSVGIEDADDIIADLEQALN